MKMITKEEFINACRERDLLDLYADHEDYTEAVSAIAPVLYDTLIALKEVLDRYEHVGATDTSASESLVDLIYDILHFGVWPEVTK